MTPDDELDQDLQHIGAESVPAPDPHFVARLEHSLRASHRGTGPAWWHQPRLTVPLVLGAAMAATVLGIVLAGPPRSGVETEGTGIAGQPSATTIDDPSSEPDVTTVPPPDPDDPDNPAGGTDGVDPDRVITGDTTTTSTPAGSATSAPGPAPPDPDPVLPTTSTPPDRPTTTAPRTTTSTTAPERTTTTTRPDPPAKRFEAAATRRDRGTVVIRWTALDSDRVASYRVIRRPPAGTSGPSAVVAERRATAERVATDEIARDAEYVVQALDAGGRVLATTAATSP